MKLRWKSSSILLILCILGCSCGDIIKTRNPTKKINTPEPEQKTSALYGTCTNFQGHWTVTCEKLRDGVPTMFHLVQQYCDLFIIQASHRSFEGKALSWSENRDAVTLHSSEESLVLEKHDGLRKGRWTRGEQTCSMKWSP